MSKRVVLVGHCNFDGPRLQQAIQSPNIDVIRVNDEADLESACAAGADLLLVNREPVGFDTDGLSIIADVHERFPEQKMMLVSDYPEAQADAVESGALPGFGKADLGSPKLMQTVKGALAD